MLISLVSIITGDFMAKRRDCLDLLAAHDLHVLEDLVTTFSSNESRELVVVQEYLLLDPSFLLHLTLLAVITFPIRLLNSEEET